MSTQSAHSEHLICLIALAEGLRIARRMCGTLFVHLPSCCEVNHATPPIAPDARLVATLAVPADVFLAHHATPERHAPPPAVKQQIAYTRTHRAYTITRAKERVCLPRRERRGANDLCVCDQTSMFRLHRRPVERAAYSIKICCFAANASRAR